MFCHPSIYIPTYIHILCYSFDFTKLHIIIYSILFFCGFANMHCEPRQRKKVARYLPYYGPTQRKRFHNARRIMKPLYHTICSYVSHLSQCLPPTFSIHHNKYLYTDYGLFYLHSTISEISAPCRFSRKLRNPLVQICIS